MQTLFVNCTDVNIEGTKELSRNRAKGYKSVVLNNLNQFSPCKLEYGDDKIEVSALNEEVAEEQQFTFLCKEFGVFGKKEGVSAKVSILVLDNDLMLVTLHEGGLIVNIDGKLQMPVVGAIPEVNFTAGDVEWVNTERVLACVKTFMSQFLYDYEYSLTLAGSHEGNASFTLHLNREETFDISQGYITAYETQKEVRQEQKRVSKIADIVEQDRGTSSEMEFDDDDDESDEDDDEFDEGDW